MSTTIILSEGNHYQWASQLKANALKEGVWRYITPGVPEPGPTGGTDEKPTMTSEDKKELREWYKAQDVALGLIHQSIDEPHKRLIGDQESQDAWTTLKNTHVSTAASSRFARVPSCVAVTIESRSCHFGSSRSQLAFLFPKRRCQALRLATMKFDDD